MDLFYFYCYFDLLAAGFHGNRSFSGFLCLDHTLGRYGGYFLLIGRVAQLLFGGERLYGRLQYGFLAFLQGQFSGHANDLFRLNVLLLYLYGYDLFQAAL